MSLPIKYFRRAAQVAEEEAPVIERALEAKPKEIPSIGEDIQARDVTPIVEEPVPTPHEQVSSDMSDLSADAKDVSKDPSKLSSFAKKHAKTLAGLGLVGAGTAGLYMAGGSNPPTPPSGSDSSNRLPASSDPLDKPAVSSGDDSEDVADSSPDATPKASTPKKQVTSEEESDKAESPIPKTQPEASPLLSKLREINFGDNSQGSAEALQNAQQQSRDAILANSLGKAGSLFGAALARADKPDTSIYEQNIKNANIPVEEYKQRVENEKNDPNSTYSQGMRSFLESQFGVKINGAPSAAQLATSVPWLEKAYEAEENRKQKGTENQLNRDLLREKNLQHSQDLKYKYDELNKIAQLKMQERNLAAKDKQELKDEEKKEKAHQKAIQLVESMRGNPAVQQAERDVYAADKANSLMQLGEGGDPNKLSPQMVALLRQELGKIAAGGQASIHELEGLDPKTFAQKFGDVWQKFSNNPSPAYAGEFIKQYKKYTDTLTKDAHKIISSRYGRVGDSLRKDMGEDRYNNFKQQYIDRFNNESEAQPAQKQVVKKGYNPKTDQTQLIYSDGTKEIVDGKQ